MEEQLQDRELISGVFVPNYVLWDRHISPGAKLFYCKVQQREGLDLEGYSIALGATKKQILKWEAELIDNDWLTIKHKAGGKKW